MAQLLDIPVLQNAISNLEGLSESQKQRINDRWLKYVIWWDSKAIKHKKWHFILRTVVVIGGVSISALIGTAIMSNLTGLRTDQVNSIQWVAFALSLLVGICSALEELLHHSEIWRDKRAAG